MYVKPTSHKISFVHNMHFNYPIVLQFSTEHDSITVALGAKFQNDWATTNNVLSKRVFVRFGSKMSFGQIAYIAQPPGPYIAHDVHINSDRESIVHCLQQSRVLNSRVALHCSDGRFSVPLIPSLCWPDYWLMDDVVKLWVMTLEALLTKSTLTLGHGTPVKSIADCEISSLIHALSSTAVCLNHCWN